ncbi:MAG: hypothetical protein AB8B78_11275 [Polaribacter sp.]
MKFRKITQLIIFISILFVFNGCFFTDLKKDETIVYEGKIFEAFDKSKPIDSVFIQGCSQKVLVLFSGAECDNETFTNKDGSFFITVEANGFESRGFRYRKEGYRNIDSCITLPNGKLECYLVALPTYFKLVGNGSSRNEFSYDKAIISFKTQTKDTVVNYFAKSFTNSNNGTSFYWSLDINSTKPTSDNSSLYTLVSDNSEVTIKADYLKNNNLLKTEFDTLFCKKGVGNGYRILKR